MPHFARTHRPSVIIALLAICATLLTTNLMTKAGNLTPPAGAPTGTMLTLEDLSALVASSDPCECQDLLYSNYTFTSTTPAIQPAGQLIYLKRVIVTKSSATADVSFTLTPAGGGSGFAPVRLGASEGMTVIDLDLVVNGFGAFAVNISSGNVVLAYQYKVVP